MGERLDPEVTLRIYFHFSKLFLCLIQVESHQGILLFLSVLRPQPVRSGLRVSETKEFSQRRSSPGSRTRLPCRALSPAVGCLCSFTFQQLGPRQRATPGLLAVTATRGPAQWGTVKHPRPQILTTWAATHGLRLPSPSMVCLLM